MHHSGLCTRRGCQGWGYEPGVSHVPPPQELAGLSLVPAASQTSITSAHLLQGIHPYFVMALVLVMEIFVGNVEGRRYGTRCACYVCSQHTFLFSPKSLLSGLLPVTPPLSLHSAQSSLTPDP